MSSQTLTRRFQPLNTLFVKSLKLYYHNECKSSLSKSKGVRKIIKFKYRKISKSTWLKAATCATAESGFPTIGHSLFKDVVLSQHKFLPFPPTLIQIPVSVQLDL